MPDDPFSKEQRAYVERYLTENPDAVKIKKKEHALPFSIHILHKDGEKKVYYTEKELGRGNFGTVRLGREFDDPDKMVALKFQDISEKGALSPRNFEEVIKVVVKEQELLREVDQFLGAAERAWSPSRFVTINKQITAMPFFNGDELAKLDTSKQTSLLNVIIALQIATKLNDLHNKNIIHTDIKAANILWDTEKQEAQIIDMGRAGKSNEEGIFGSYWGVEKAIMAPECIKQYTHKGEKYGFQFSRASDVYSLGLALKKTYNLENKLKLTLEDRLIKAHLEQMISENPGDRPSLDSTIKIFNEIAQKNKNDEFGNLPNFRRDMNQSLETLRNYIQKKKNFRLVSGDCL